MEKKRQVIAGLLVMVMLCCACSSKAGMRQETATTASSTAAIVSMAQTGSGFTDVVPGAWYEEAANWCREQGILDGDTFSPDMEMTRATVAEALYRAEGSPAVNAANFPDVPAGSYCPVRQISLDGR